MNEDAIKIKKKLTSEWFYSLQREIISKFLKMEEEYLKKTTETKKDLIKLEDMLVEKTWEKDMDDFPKTGIIAKFTGNIFQKAAINVSITDGIFQNSYEKNVPGASDKKFWATGISLIAHMKNPFVPAIHMNTRYILTRKEWFGGVIDLNPIYDCIEDTEEFHTSIKGILDKYNKDYYPNFKKECDEYFYIKHRKKSRGVGGIFFDNFATVNWENDLEMIKEIGQEIIKTFPNIVNKHLYKPYDAKDLEAQAHRRGEYVEFNLLYDRGTKFGLESGGNPESILSSMPPLAKWV